MDINTVGVVIREQTQGENDKLLTILTPEGKIYALAKGVKKISSKNAPACQLFVYGEYELIQGKGSRFTVKTASAKEMFYNMRTDILRYSLGCYFAEIILGTVTENNDESQTLRLFLNTLFALSNKPEIPVWLIKGAFEFKLLCTIGLMPDFGTCYECGCDMEIKPVNTFSFEEAALVCEKCKRNNSSFTCTVSSDTVLSMMYIAKATCSSFLSFKLDDSNAPEFSFVCENYLLHKTERSYETLRIYKSILNSLGEK